MNTFPDSFIVWQGPSELDGSPTICVVTGVHGTSRNSKTGPMVQVYILRADMHPTEAVQSGADSAICGDCKHRPFLINARKAPLQAALDALKGQRTAEAKASREALKASLAALDAPCYVEVGKSVGATWKSAVSGAKPTLTLEEAEEACAGRDVRLGAYGDPAALPRAVIAALCRRARRWTGYTHQWQDARFDWLRPYVRASADTLDEEALAHRRGWRTFTVMQGSTETKHERAVMHCPAAKETGARLTCQQCTVCGGTESPRGSKVLSVRIHAH